MVSVPGLKVTVDLDNTTTNNIDDVPMEVEQDRLFCPCQSEYCDCGSNLGVTEAAARKVYKHLSLTNDRAALIADGYRENVLHVWGTHNLSTEEILNWISDYQPNRIEWINDASCNIVFNNANTVLRAMVDCAEPFDRRVALAAAAALAALLDPEPDEESERSESKYHLDGGGGGGGADLMGHREDALDSIEEFSQYLPPTGRWYKALSTPAKTISLFLRPAHKSDVKTPGAERRSLYYRRYGNPNYCGMTGILSRSYRRRLRLTRRRTGGADGASNGVRTVRLLPSNFAEVIARAYADDPGDDEESMFNGLGDLVGTGLQEEWESVAPERDLVVYNDLYDTESIAKTTTNGVGMRSNLRVDAIPVGRRREAVAGPEFPIPQSPKQPRKWPRKNRGPAPNRWLTDDDQRLKLPVRQAYAFSPLHSDGEDEDSQRINVVDLREPWASEASPLHQPFVFGNDRSQSPAWYDRLNDPSVTTTITLMPDTCDSPEINHRLGPPNQRSLLTSMSMVADMEEEQQKRRRGPSSRSLANRLGSRGPHKPRREPPPPRRQTRDVWQRLG